MKHGFRSLALWLVLLCVTSVAAQQPTICVGQGQLVTIAPDTRVVVNGHLRSQGTIMNQGTLRVSGDWRNEQTYTDTPGSQVILSGATQTIDHQGQQFHHLVVRGAGTKTLRSEARIADTLALTEGVLASSTRAVLTLETTAVVAGGSASAYVEQTMVYRGGGRRHFPLGLRGEYLPITLTNVTGDRLALEVSVVTPNPPATALDASLESVSPARYWRLEAREGTFAGSPATLTVNQGDGLADLVGAVVVQSDEPGGRFTSAGQSDRNGSAPSGTVTSEAVIDQPIVAVGTTGLFSVDNQVLVPSAFAPEAPNPVNRSVKIYAKTLLPDSFLFRIFDRWGNLVYHTTSLVAAQERGWEGVRASDRSPVPPGVYQYHVRGVFENGTPVDQSGTITLFR